MTHPDLDFAAAVANDRAELTHSRFVAAIAWLGDTLENMPDDTSAQGLGGLLSLLAEKAEDDRG
jgi:hypothetical protein